MIVEADLSAGYYDFTGVEEGEKRLPETRFQCRISVEKHDQSSEDKYQVLREVIEELWLDEIAAEEARQDALNSGEMAGYQFALQQKIMRNWVRPASAKPGIECVIDVHQARGGDVITATVVSLSEKIRSA